jgi:hypothetical protein
MPEPARPSPGQSAPHIEGEHPGEEDGQIGIFGSWRALYVTVVLYTAALTVLLYVFTRLLDFSS